MHKSFEDKKYIRLKSIHQKNLGKLVKSGLLLSSKENNEGEKDRGFLPSISANQSLNKSSEELKMTSIEEDLQNQIHEHLKMISEVVKKTATINEQTEAYRTQLQELNTMFDLIKADAEDKIVNFKVQAMSLTSKRNSAQMRINQIKTDIENLKMKIDNWRIDECHFASSLEVDKRTLQLKEAALKKKAEMISNIDLKVSRSPPHNRISSCEVHLPTKRQNGRSQPPSTEESTPTARDGFRHVSGFIREHECSRETTTATTDCQLATGEDTRYLSSQRQKAAEHSHREIH